MNFMKFHKILLLSTILLSLAYASCTKHHGVAPFFDKLFLEYSVGGLKTIFSVNLIDNQKYRITEVEKSRVLRDDVEELYVDAYGKVYKSSFKDYEGGYSPVWIPVHEMKIGDSFDDGYTVIRKDKWKKWEVLVIKNPLVDEERYYELNTGYWVGSLVKTTVRSGEIVLINTNANIPEIKE